jgi:hypothetical protein
LEPSAPFSTLAQAIAASVANRGDVIYLMAGHVETVAGAYTINKAGVQIFGLGAGSNRPTFTLSATASVFNVSAANVTFRNILITSTIAAVVKAFNVTAANVTFDGVDYQEDGTTDLLQFILTSAAADFLTVKNCKWYRDTTSASSVSAWIGLVGADYCEIVDNYLTLKGTAANSADGFVVGATTLSKSVHIARNAVVISVSTGAVPISLLANSTGIVHDNRVSSAKTAVAGSVALASAYGHNNLANNTVNTSGLLDPVVDT